MNRTSSNENRIKHWHVVNVHASKISKYISTVSSRVVLDARACVCDRFLLLILSVCLCESRFVHFKCKWKIAFGFLSKFYQRIVRNKVISFRSGAFRLTRFTQCKREKKKKHPKPKINLKEIKIEANRNFGIW